MGRVKAARYYVGRIKRKVKLDAAAKSAFNRALEKASSRSSHRKGWVTSRDYDSYYNPFFRACTGKNIVDLLAGIHKNKKRPIRILEDGSGQGLFLVNLKRELNWRGIASKTTA